MTFNDIMDKWRHKYNDDAKQKRAQFIDISSDLREVFKFAHPEQIMKAVQVYASDAYGFMLSLVLLGDMQFIIKLRCPLCQITTSPLINPINQT